MLRRIWLMAALFTLAAIGLFGLSVEPVLAGTPDDTSTIERYYNENIALQSTNSTTYIDAVSINFTPPTTKDYLVIFSALTNNSTNTYSTILQLNINGTSYSETHHLPVDETLNWRSFGGQKVITASAGVPQDISIQYKTEHASATAYVQRAVITIIEITNYENAEANAETSTTSHTYVNKVTLTFTPSEAGDYLIMATTNSRNSVTGKDCYAEIVIDGIPRAELTTVDSPYASAASASIMNFSVAEHTLQINYKTESSGTAFLKDTRITVVKASDLGTIYYASSVSESKTQSPNYVDKATLNFTPAARKDYLVITDGLGRQENTRYAFLANVDIDGTGYGEYIFVPGNRTLYRSFMMLNKLNFSAASHDVKIQYKTNHASASSEAYIKHANITAIETDTAESYSDSPHTTVSNNFTGPTGSSVYIWSHGLRSSQNYTVAYYDANPSSGGNKIYSQNVTSTGYGNLSSQYLLSSDGSATAGTWHAVVFDPEFGTPPDDYDSAAAAAGYVVEDSFTVQAGAITDTVPQIVFTTAPQTLTAGQASGIMTVQTQDAGGTPVNVTSATTINLTTTSGTGRFDTSAGGTFNGSVTSVTIPNGANSANFYYKDTTAGSPTITADESPSQGWAQATQAQTVNASAISQIIFTTASQTLTAGNVSSVMTIQTRDVYGNPANVIGATTIDLSSTSGAGRFDTSASGAFDGSITSVTIPGGANSVNFYYEDTVASTPTITAAENPSQGWTDATQQQTVISRAISRIVFITLPQTLTSGQISGVIVIQTQDDFGNPVEVGANTIINLASTSGTGRFDTDAGGAFDGSITSVTILSGTNSASFFYRDNATGTPSITADESPSQGWTQGTQSVTIIPGNITQLAFTTAPQTLTGGQPSAVMTVQAQDEYGNPANVSGNITIDLNSDSGAGRFDTSASGAFDGSITSVTILSGTSSVNFYYHDTTAGTPTITAAENPSQTWTDAAQQQTVNARAISRIVFTTASQTITAGQVSGIMTIQARDAYGNPVNVTADTTLNLTSTSGTGRFDTSAGGAFDGSITSATISSGANSVSFYYRDTAAGLPTVTADESPSQGWAAANQVETVNAGAITQIVFTTPARTFAADQASGIMTVQTRDTYGNPASVSGNTTIDLSSDSGTGRFDTSASGAFDGSITSVTILNGTSSASFYYKDTTAGSPTVTAAENPSQTWTDAAQQQTVNPGTPNYVVFTTAPQTITAGQASAVMTVQIQDNVGNPVTAATDTTIDLSSDSGTGRFDTSAGGAFDGSITSVTILSGSDSASFYYKDTTAATPTITAAENPSQGWTDASQHETINPDALDHFSFNSISDQIVHHSFHITITAYDQFDNQITTYTGTNSLSDSTGTISPTGTTAFTGGVWTGEVTVYSVQSGNQVSTSIGGESGDSNTFDVGPAAVSHLAFTTAPQTITAGQISGVMTVQTQDAFDNPVDVTADTTLNLLSSSGSGIFYSDAAGTLEITSVTITSGTNSASFYYGDTAAGLPVITAAESPDQGLANAVQEQTVNAGAVLQIVFVTPARTITAGHVSGIISIETQDAFGNVANTAADITINLSSSSGDGILYSDAAGTLGISSATIFSGANSASFYYGDTTTGTPTITAAENPSQGWTDASQEETVNPGAVSRLVFTTPARTFIVGMVSDIMTIRPEDAYGNNSNVVSDTTINLSSSSGNGAFYSDGAGNNLITTVIISDSIGSVSFYYRDNTVGSPTITAAESPDKGFSDAIQQETVNAIPATRGTNGTTGSSKATLRVDWDGEITLGEVDKRTSKLKENIFAFSQDGQAELDIPTGTVALSRNGARVQLIRVITTPPSDSPYLQGDDYVVLHAWEMTPHGAAFSQPLIFRVKYDSETLSATAQENELYFAYWNGSEWTPLNSSVNTASKTVTVSIEHFTTFGLIVKVPLDTSETTPPKTPEADSSEPSAEPEPESPSPPEYESPPAATVPGTNWPLIGGIIAGVTAAIIVIAVRSVQKRRK